MIALPPLKWAGGKRALAADILRFLPSPGARRYFEPFVGAGAVFLAYNPDSTRAFLNDANTELVQTYAALAADVEAVIGRLSDHRARHSEGHFYDVRAWDPESLSPADLAARMIYLNRTCFNGLYRVSKKSGFNVPFGDYDHPPNFDEENLRAVSNRLQGVTVTSLDFEDFLERCAPAAGDVVYFDPPYVPVSKTSAFTSFTKEKFTEADQRRLAKVFHALAARGVHVVASNSAAPLVRELYASEGERQTLFLEMTRRGTISSKSGERGRVAELLIVHLPDNAPSLPWGGLPEEGEYGRRS